MATYVIEERLGWRRWVTPKPLEEKPIHRWYVFPHSFSSELVHDLIDEWGLGHQDRILDPFAGAGTTLLAAREKRVPATGYDLSPLAILATRAKIANFNRPRLQRTSSRLKRRLNPTSWNGHSRVYPRLVEEALPGPLLGAFDSISNTIDELKCSDSERDLLRLALLTTLPQYTRLVATGGWLQWTRKHKRIQSLPRIFSERIDRMLLDLQEMHLNRERQWTVSLSDARQMPDPDGKYAAVITSPPYPNRHDYTRVFGVELMFGFLNWEQTRRLRYQSFHSHPEAHPTRPDSDGYASPLRLRRALTRIKKVGSDPRVLRMLEGYFLDMYLCLREMSRVCRDGANIAVIVGNAQYSGEPVLVDQLTAEIGEQAGLSCEHLLVARYRGNSAQQMARFGRNQSRETVVVFKRPRR